MLVLYHIIVCIFAKTFGIISFANNNCISVGITFYYQIDYITSNHPSLFPWESRYTGWGPQDCVQLPYKWLISMVYGRYKYSLWMLMGYYYQRNIALEYHGIISHDKYDTMVMIFSPLDSVQLTYDLVMNGIKIYCHKIFFRLGYGSMSYNQVISQP